MHNAKVENKTIIALLEIYPKKYQFQKDGNLGFKSSVSKDSINFKKYKTNGMARAVWSTHLKVKCVHMPIHIMASQPNNFIYIGYTVMWVHTYLCKKRKSQDFMNYLH